MVILLQLLRSMQLTPLPVISNCESTWLLAPFKEIAGEIVNVVDEVVVDEGVVLEEEVVPEVVVCVDLALFLLLYDATPTRKLGEFAAAPKLF